jgi:hypothetical protein
MRRIEPLTPEQRAELAGRSRLCQPREECGPSTLCRDTLSGTTRTGRLGAPSPASSAAAVVGETPEGLYQHRR